ncbi:MAG: protein-L-isoaspartate(D-aspartate) O-methyltransferase [Planctomycetota bacterium]
MTVRQHGFRVAGMVTWMVLVPSGSACAPPAEKASGSQPAAATQPQDGARRQRPRTDERKAERAQMVEWQIAGRGVRDEAVLEAMRNVPRHWFVPRAVQPDAYEDRPLPIGEGQTISQPYIVAFMTEALKLTPGAKVLEVGTGSGYQAAVLSELTAQVYTVEIVEPLARLAMETFRRHGYDTIVAKVGDGYAGWPEHAPFDAVIVTCAPETVPPELIKQLRPGGRLCIPVGPTGIGQDLLLVTKQPDGTTTTENLLPVAFVPMTHEAPGERGKGPGK